MEHPHEASIAAIKAGMQCPKGFRCVDKDCGQLCQARECGLENYLDCCEESPEQCSFALQFGDGHICRCPLRVYLAKELKK